MQVTPTPPRGGMLAGCQAAAEFLIRLGLYVSAAVILAMLGLIVADVAARNILHLSLLVADEISGYLLVALCFFGVGYSLRTGALLRVEFILVALPPRMRVALGLLYDVLSLGVMLILTYYLYRVTLSSYTREMVAPTLLETPVWIPQIAMPLGGAIMVVALMLEIGLGIARLLGHEPAPPPAPAHDTTDFTA